MSDFKLKNHRVKKALFEENTDKEKNNNIQVGLEGSTFIPKDSINNRKVMIQLKLDLGEENARLNLKLETVYVFEPEDETVIINEESVEKNCLPIALATLRKTVKSVTEAFGLTPIDLPPFEREIIE